MVCQNDPFGKLLIIVIFIGRYYLNNEQCYETFVDIDLMRDVSVVLWSI